MKPPSSERRCGAGPIPGGRSSGDAWILTDDRIHAMVDGPEAAVMYDVLDDGAM